MAQGLAGWAHNPKVRGLKPRSAMKSPSGCLGRPQDGECASSEADVPCCPPCPLSGTASALVQPLGWPFTLWGSSLGRALDLWNSPGEEFGRPWKWLCESFFGELLSLLKSCLQRVGKPSGGAFWEKWIRARPRKSTWEQPLEEEALESFLEKAFGRAFGLSKSPGRGKGRR